MRLQIQSGDTVEITVGSRRIIGEVNRVNNRPSLADGEPSQWDFWDLEYTITGGGTIGDPGRWKQNVDGGTVAKVEKQIDHRAEATRLRKKAKWHVDRAGSGGSWKAAEEYESQAIEHERQIWQMGDRVRLMDKPKDSSIPDYLAGRAGTVTVISPFDFGITFDRDPSTGPWSFEHGTDEIELLERPDAETYKLPDAEMAAADLALAAEEEAVIEAEWEAAEQAAIGKGPEAIALAHEKAAIAHEEAAIAAALCRNYTDEQRELKEAGAKLATQNELQKADAACKASETVAEMTRVSPSDGDLRAAEAAEAAYDSPMTSDRHKEEAEVASRAAALAHRKAAAEYRRSMEAPVSQPEWGIAYDLVQQMHEDNTVKDWLRFITDMLGPDWVRGWVAETRTTDNEPDPMEGPSGMFT